MGNHYYHILFVGFTVPEDYAFEYEELPGNRPCSHELPDDPQAQFCAQCGKPLLATPILSRNLRTDRGFTADDVNLDDLMTFKIGDAEIRVCWYYIPHRTDGAEGVIVAGTFITSLKDPRWVETYQTRLDMPVLPDREELEKALKDRDIPYDQDSYGFHVLIDVG